MYELLLNTSSSKYEIGDEVSIYYYPDNMTLAYSKSSEYIMLGYVGIGLIASITSAVVFFLEKKKNK